MIPLATSYHGLAEYVALVVTWPIAASLAIAGVALSCLTKPVPSRICAWLTFAPMFFVSWAMLSIMLQWSYQWWHVALSLAPACVAIATILWNHRVR